MTAIAGRLFRRPRQEPILLDGRPARFRLGQNLLWTIILSFTFIGFVAGVYFNFLEVPWHWFGSSHVYTLKTWWDSGMGFITSPNWYLYRHGLRDLGEPAAAVMGGRTILASRKSWGLHINGWEVTGRIVALLAVAGAMILGGVWVINFGLPQWWHAEPSWFVTYSVGNVILGLIIGQLCHRIWRPAGATIQGYFVDRVADRVRLGYQRVPLWVRYPVSPVQVRERFVELRTHPDEKIVTGKLPRSILTVAALIFIYLVITGLIAKYWIGHGHPVPYLAPVVK